MSRKRSTQAATSQGAAAGDAFDCRIYVPEDKVAEREAAAVRGALAAARLLQSVAGTEKPPATRPKRSTEPGEAHAKLVAALTHHHRYADGGCLNFEPVGCNELARLAGVSKATAARFFAKYFKGHVHYRYACGHKAKLRGALMLLNGEFLPHRLLNTEPADDSVADDSVADDD